MKINSDRILFGTGLALIGVSKLWRFQNNSDTIFLAAGLALLSAKILMGEKYTTYQAGAAVFFFSLGFVIFAKTGELNLFSIMLIIFSMKGIELHRALKEVLVINLVFFVGIIFLCKIGIVYDDVYYFSRPGEVMARHSYGLGHPNQVFLRLFVISAIIVACYREKYHKLKMFLVLIISIIFYKGTDSRSGFCCVILFLAIILLLDAAKKRMKKLISIFMVVAYWMVVTVSMSFVFLNGSIVDLIDKIITGRISLAKKFLAYHSLSLFGIEKNITSSFVVDNSYIYMLIHYGIIIGLLYVILVGYTLNIMRKKMMVYEMAALLVLHIYAFAECILISPIFNFSIIFMGAFLSNNISLNRGGTKSEIAISDYAGL